MYPSGRVPTNICDMWSFLCRITICSLSSLVSLAQDISSLTIFLALSPQHNEVYNSANPPFVMGDTWEGDNNDIDRNDDFIADLESRL